MERVTGPFDGVYIAAYTTELDGLFFGYAKLCKARPANPWVAQTILKTTTPNGWTREVDALEAAENRAMTLCKIANGKANREVSR